MIFRAFHVGDPIPSMYRSDLLQAVSALSTKGFAAQAKIPHSKKIHN